MASFLKRKLSGSTDGKGIKVAATATPGTLIHTAVAGVVPGTFDEIWLYAYNGHTTAVQLTLEFGGVAMPDNTIIVTLAAKAGLQLLVPGLILQNAAVVRAFAATSNVITLSGWVNSMTD